jgi:hypothetical protein
MRRLIRPLALVVLLASLTASLQSQDDSSGDPTSTSSGNPTGLAGFNQLNFAANSPTPTQGGVDVSLTIQPNTGFTCTSVTIAVVDANTLQTLATATIPNPGATVTQSFTGLGSGVAVTIDVTSVFQNGNQFDTPYLEGAVTTN